MPLPLAPLVGTLLTTAAGGYAVKDTIDNHNERKEIEAKREENEKLKKETDLISNGGMLELQDKKDPSNYLNMNQDSNTLSQEAQETADIKDQMQQKRYRNTGIAYFDNKENLSLGDAYLAKMLNLDVSYIDMNLNANVNQKKTNVNQALSAMYENNNAVLQYSEGMNDYFNNELDSVGNRISRGINRATGGFTWSSTENKRENNLYEYRKRGLAKMMSDNSKVTNKDLELAEGMMHKWGNKNETLASLNNFYQIARMKQQENMNKIEEIGFNIPEAEKIKLYAIDNLIKSTTNGKYDNKLHERNRNAILLLQQNKDDPRAINAAVQMIFTND